MLRRDCEHNHARYTDLPSLPIKRKIFCFFGVFFKSSAFQIYFEVLPLFPNYTGHSKYVDIHMKVLLLSTSFVISVLFGDVEMDRLILCHRQIKYR